MVEAYSVHLSSRHSLRPGFVKKALLVLGPCTDPEQNFMTEVAGQCKKARHHPEWSNRYNKTVIRWTTHDANALTAKDVAMADICDEAGQRHGEVDGQLVQDDIAPQI